MVSFALSDEEAAVRDEVRKFAQQEIKPHDREIEEARAAPAALRESYEALGLATLEWPESLSGAGLGMITRVLVEEELAAACGATALALHGPGPAGYAVWELASESQRKTWADRVAKATVSLALSEGDLGAEAGSVAVKAECSAGGYLLKGKKLFCLHADSADYFLVFARVDESPRWLGVRAFLVEKNAAGIVLGREDDRAGLRAVRSFAVEFQDVLVPMEGLLGDFETPYAPAAVDRFLARTWILNAARQVGIGRAAVEYSIYYAQDRTAFGKKIGSFQGVAFKIADAATDVESARLLLHRAAFQLDRGRDAFADAALAAVHANEAAVRATIDAVQVLGGAGFMEDYPVEKWMRDARALAQLFGHDPLRNHVAGERLFGPLGEGSEALDPAAAFAAFGQAFGS